MFAGPRGRQLVDETLNSVDSRQMPEDRKKLLRDMLGSVQSFYQQAETDPNAGRVTLS
jgi:hypothetical protein